MTISAVFQRRVVCQAAYWAAVAALLCCAAFMLLYQVSDQVIWSFDEGRHGVSAYEMMKNGDLIVNTNRWEPDFYNLKPPLSFWAIMLGYRLFGFTVLGFRFQCLASIFFTLLTVTLWVKKRHGALASVTALALCVANRIFFERTSDADELYWLIFTIAMLCMLDSRRDIRWLYGSALCFGLGFLDKSYHAVVIPLVCFVFLCLTGRMKALRLRHYLLLLFCGLLPVAPWAIARYLRDGTAFFAAMIRTDVVERVSGAGSPWYQYLWELVQNPAVVAAGLLGAWAALLRLKKGRHPGHEEIGLLCWTVLPVALFSCITAKLPHYIMPMMTGTAIIGGLGAKVLWNRAAKSPKPLRAALAGVTAAALLVLIVGNGVYAMNRDSRGSYQRALFAVFDRREDSGLHAYIQAGPASSEWAQCDMLCALLAGDVLCLDGGVEAFEADVEKAVVLVDNTCLQDQLLARYNVIYATDYQTALAK